MTQRGKTAQRETYFSLLCLSKVDLSHREFPRSYLGTGMAIYIRTVGDQTLEPRIGLVSTP
ncbi:MAG: hypothetical protein HYZ16_02635 [Bacteroidetes bacterium]|nr:hypothetical protein [Bacteroidota bacterium]